MNVIPRSTARCTSEIASLSLSIFPTWNPPMPTHETRTPVEPSSRVGMSPAARAAARSESALTTTAAAPATKVRRSIFGRSR